MAVKASLARSAAVLPRIQVIRGLPGSGKSTLGSQYDCLRLELDQFCISGGRYVWTPENDKRAHAWLKKMVRDSMKVGIDLVVCGVMPTSKGMIATILALAVVYGYEVYVKDLPQRFKNKHGCRDCDLKRFASLFVPFKKMDFDTKLMQRVTCGLMPKRNVLVPVPKESQK